MSATSFVISILEKKGRSTRINSNILLFFTFKVSFSANLLKIHCSRNPATMIIIQKSRVSTFQSKYPQYAFEGVTKNIDNAPNKSAMENTVSFFINAIIFFMIHHFLISLTILLKKDSIIYHLCQIIIITMGIFHMIFCLIVSKISQILNKFVG